MTILSLRQTVITTLICSVLSTAAFSAGTIDWTDWPDGVVVQLNDGIEDGEIHNLYAVAITANGDGTSGEGITMIDNNITVFSSLQSDATQTTTVSSSDDVILNSDTDDDGAGVIYFQKAGSTLMSLDSSGTSITTGVSIDGDLDMTDGSISNVTTITASGTISGGNLSTGGTLGVTGTSTLASINSTGTLTQVGTTNINTTGTGATNLGNTSSDVTINGATNTITANATTGTNNIEAKYNNIGISTAASINTIGNTNSATTVSSYAGAGYNTLTDAAATMGTNTAGNYTTGGMMQTNATTATIRASNSGTLATNGTTGIMDEGVGGGYTAYSSPQNTGTGTTVAGIVDNKLYTNKISGSTFVDGNVYINGTLDFVSIGSANTIVIGSGTDTSTLAGATQGTQASSAILMKDSTGTQTVVDANGKLTNVSGVAAESTASVTLTNGVGNTHGLVVTETQATLSGGTYSSSLTMNDNGATFSNSATGRPIQVHGVADGTADFDAVNVRQLKNVVIGVAGVSAMSNIPQVEQDKTFSLGMGLGHFDNNTALALGGSYRLAPNAVFKASVATSAEHNIFDSASTVYGVGAAFSW